MVDVAHGRADEHQQRITGPLVAFRIGPYDLLFRAEDPDVRFYVHRSHAPFVVEPGPADCELVWRIAPVRASQGPVVRSAGARWTLRRTERGEDEFVFHSGDAAPTMSLAFSAQRDRVEATQAPRATAPGLAFASEHPWAEFVVSRMLGRDGGLLLHSSAVVKDGVAYLFAGHTGTGKSTISAIAEADGARVLSDDRTIITLGGAGALAWGTPWHGTLARSAAEVAPIRAISLLVQDTTDRLEPLTPQRAWKELFVRLIMPGFSADDTQRTLEALERLVQRVRVHVLHFRPRVEAFRLVERSDA